MAAQPPTGATGVPPRQRLPAAAPAGRTWPARTASTPPAPRAWPHRALRPPPLPPSAPPAEPPVPWRCGWPGTPVPTPSASVPLLHWTRPRRWTRRAAPEEWWGQQAPPAHPCFGRRPLAHGQSCPKEGSAPQRGHQADRACGAPSGTTARLCPQLARPAAGVPAGRSRTRPRPCSRPSQRVQAPAPLQMPPAEWPPEPRTRCLAGALPPPARVLRLGPPLRARLHRPAGPRMHCLARELPPPARVRRLGPPPRQARLQQQAAPAPRRVAVVVPAPALLPGVLVLGPVLGPAAQVPRPVAATAVEVLQA
mmetsp:Transcript_107982/g.344270  ORF Transcript_107982/g.344270 Transcript_107982/m.344270 type:complete len:309 (+) Transcript_107982:326-1252(+)